MLIQFSVENFRSILDRQTLSMAASNYFKELEGLNTFEVGVVEPVPRLLRSNVIYGPNASGKSSLINALSFMRDRVINSAKESQAGEEIDVTPFKLTSASRKEDSEFEVEFVEEGIRYQYGFRCNKQRFTEEWLFAYPEGRTQKWFQRVFDPEANTDSYRFSTAFLGGRKRRHDWREQTRPNALFLSTALQLNNEQLKPVLRWFQQRLRVLKAFPMHPSYTIARCREERERSRIIDFMNSADLSISNIHVEAQTFSTEFLPDDMPSPLREEIIRDMTGKEIMKVRFLHEDVESHEPIEFEVQEESAGTRALFAFAGPWLDVMEHERILVVDELDASLHPLIVHFLIKRLHHQNNKAQLIFTTHDTTLLSQKILRRDQVWFMEKNDKNATELYPLSDFSPRDNEAVERGYLNGRYGGIPFLKDLDFYGV